MAAHDTHDDHICLSFLFQFSFVMFLISRGHHFPGVYPKVLEHETTDTGFRFLSHTTTTNWQLALLGNGEDDLHSATTHHHDGTGHCTPIPLEQPIDLDPPLGARS